MPQHFTEDDYFRADAWGHLQLVHGSDAEAILQGILLGIRLHDSDPELANRLFQLMIRQDHLQIGAVTDQLAASMRSWGKR